MPFPKPLTVEPGMYVRWGARVREIREAQGKSVMDLAVMVGIDKSHMARIESGANVPGDEVRIRIATALGQQVRDLFSYPDTTTPTAAAS